MDNNRMKDGMPMGDEQPGQGALAMMQNQGGELAQKVVQYVCGCKYQHFFFYSIYIRMWHEKRACDRRPIRHSRNQMQILLWQNFLQSQIEKTTPI